MDLTDPLSLLNHLLKCNITNGLPIFLVQSHCRPIVIALSLSLSPPFSIAMKMMFLCTCLALMVAAHGAPWHGRCGSSTAPYKTIVVNQSGHGNFTSVQAAIDSVPENNMDWICIRVLSGTYREKVKIPYEKPYILLKGDGKRKTEVVWDDHDTVAQSPTFSSFADNIVVKAITFRNSFNNPINNNPRVPAVAAMIAGDKSAFYRCGFFGLQDTLWDDQGRHYYRRCTIQGAVDFIFGGGQSIFENCGISVVGAALPAGLPGFIAAQGRTNPNDANGFVFKNCMVHGNGSAFLGRPWRGYSRVLFYNTNFSSVVEPRGWDAWTFAGQENQLMFSEHGCYGEGSDTSRRVTWEKKLTSQDLNKMTSTQFIDTEGWLQKQPY